MSFVYVLTNPAMPGLVKIGRAEDAELRNTQLYNTSVPFPFELKFACRVDNPIDVEQALHIAFGPKRVNPRREFFRIEPEQAIVILRLLHTEEATEVVAAAIRERELEGEQGEVAAAAAAGERYRRTRRPHLNFEDMGIPVGSTLESTICEKSAIVVSPRKVSVDGQECSLTAVTQQILGLDYAIQPGAYWRFGGKLLSEIYEDTYPAAE